MFANIETVKEAARQLFNSENDAATDALNIALNILEKNMSEQDFIAFCESVQ